MSQIIIPFKKRNMFYVLNNIIIINWGVKTNWTYWTTYRETHLAPQWFDLIMLIVIMVAISRLVESDRILVDIMAW